jgi:hypothetical protein
MGKACRGKLLCVGLNASIKRYEMEGNLAEFADAGVDKRVYRK